MTTSGASCRTCTALSQSPTSYFIVAALITSVALGLVNLLEQRLEALRLLRSRIEFELKLRKVLHLHLPSELGSKIRRCALQPAHCGSTFTFVAEHRDENPGMPQVPGDPHGHYGN